MAVRTDPNLTLTGIAPAALGANVNDWAPAGLSGATSIYASASGADRDLTGLSGGSSGRLIMIMNVGTVFALNVVAESASSTAANRFASGIGIFPGDAVAWVYDGASSRWRRAWSR